MPDAVDIARALLAKAAELGVALSDHDLHRLAAHAQGWFMARHYQPLFEDPIIAGEDGPFVPAIRDALRNGGIARLAGDDEAYELIGQFAFRQAGATVRNHLEAGGQPYASQVTAAIDAAIAEADCGEEIDREILCARARSEMRNHLGTALDPDAAIRQLDEDSELLQRLLERAARPLAESAPRR